MRSSLLKSSNFIPSNLNFMKETWTFDFPKSENPKDQLIQLFALKQNELGIFLSYYYKSEGAVVENVEVDPRSLQLIGQTGSVRFDFDLVHFNACLAIHDKKRESMEVQLQLDSGKETVLLIGPIWQEREMDEI